MGAVRNRSNREGKTKPTAAFNDAPDNPPLVPFPTHPSVTAEIWEQILLELSEGRGLLRICREHADFPSRATVLRAIAEGTPEQRDTYARACEDGADAMVEEAMDIADDASRDTITKVDRDGKEYEVADHEWIARSKLRVEQRRWHAGKLRPKKYGEKIDHTSGGEPLFASIKRVIVKP